MSETQSIALANPDRVGGPLIGQLGGVGSARDTAKVADYAVKPGDDEDFDVVNADSPCEVCTQATGDDLQVTGPCRVVGFSVKTAITTAAIEVEDGLNDTGTYKFSIPSGAAVGVHHFGGNGIQFNTGAFLDFGSAAGSVALLVRLAAGSVIEA